MKWIKLSCKLFIFGVISAFIILIGLYVYAYFAPALDIKNAKIDNITTSINNITV